MFLHASPESLKAGRHIERSSSASVYLCYQAGQACHNTMQKGWGKKRLGRAEAEAGKASVGHKGDTQDEKCHLEDGDDTEEDEAMREAGPLI